MTTRRRGRPPHPDILTPAEWRVLEHLREGRTNADIAIRIGVSPETVKYHVSNMLTKLGFTSREELAAWRPGRERVAGRWWTFAVPLVVREAGVAVAILVGFGTLLGIAAWTAMDGNDDPSDAATEADATEQLDDEPAFPGRLLFVSAEPHADGIGAALPGTVHILDPGTGDYRRHRGDHGTIPVLSPRGTHVAAVRIIGPVDTELWPETFTHVVIASADPPFPSVTERNPSSPQQLSPVPPYLRDAFVTDRDAGHVDRQLAAVPSWHPSGDRLVFVALQGGPGQGVTTLEVPSGVVTPSTSDCYYPAWSPDGAVGVCVSSVDDAFDLLLGDVDEHFNGDLQRPEFDMLPHFAGHDLHPVISPDGRYLAWWRYSAEGNEPHVFVADLEVSPHPVHDLGPGYHPRWSPTGEHLVFTAISGDSTRVAVASPPSWNWHILHPSDATEKSPAWSPDGEYIAFVSNRHSPHGEILITTVDGAELHRLDLNFVGQVILSDGPPDITALDWAERPAGASWP